MSRLTRRLDGAGRAATIHRQAPVMTALDDARYTAIVAALREEFPSQRVSHIIREIEEAL